MTINTDSFTLLDFAPGAWLEETTDEGLPAFGVWLDDDIIGTGETASEAIADARATVRGWESGPVARFATSESDDDETFTLVEFRRANADALDLEDMVANLDALHVGDAAVMGLGITISRVS